MFKKILVLLVLTLTILTFTPKKIKAVSPPIYSWDLCETISVQMFMCLDIEIGLENILESITFSIPDMGYNTAILGSRISNVRVKNYEGDEIFNAPLSDYITVEGGDTFTLEMSAFIDPYRVSINVYQTFLKVDTPEGIITYFETEDNIVFNYASRVLMFYTYRLETTQIYNTFQQLVYFENPETINPPNTEDYIFLGWKTITGEWYVFGDPIKDEWKEQGVNDELFRIKAYYISLNIENSIIPPVIEEGNAPPFIADVLSIWSANNFTGYMLLYTLLTIIVIVIFAFLKLSGFVFVITHLLITVGFIAMEMLPVFAIVIAFLVYATATLFIVKRGGETDGEI